MGRGYAVYCQMLLQGIARKGACFKKDRLPEGRDMSNMRIPPIRLDLRRKYRAEHIVLPDGCVEFLDEGVYVLLIGDVIHLS